MILSIVEAGLRALLVALTVWAGLRLLRVRNVLAQKSAWGLVLAAALLMPLLLPLAVRWNVLPAATLALPAHWHMGSAPQAAPEASLELQAAAEAPAISARVTRPVQRFGRLGSREPANPAASIMTLASPGSGSAASRSTIETAPPMQRHVARPQATVLPSPAVLAGLVYLTVCAALLLRLLYGLAAALTLWCDAQPVTLAQASAAGLPLRSSRAVSSPVTIGSGVVLPDDFDQWDAVKLRVVLAHERSHIRQGDFYLQLLAGLYAVIFWFSPLGWWLKRTLSDLGEAISDRAGLEEAASRSSYAQLLLEFAAQPRPTLIGVAMARTSSLSHRIERLLNDATFRSAFAGSRRRALLAILLVPVALFAATTLIRVQAAEAAPPATVRASIAGAALAPAGAAQEPQIAPTAATGVSNPDQAPAVAPAAPQAPIPPPAAGDLAPVAVPPVPAVPSADADLAEPPTPPEPSDADGDSITVGDGQSLTITNSRGRHYVTAAGGGSGRGSGSRSSSRSSSASGGGRGYRYSYDSDGDSWALISGSDEHIYFSGDHNRSNTASIDRARKMAHGKFLWFTRDGKSYLIDDTTIIAGIEAMYKPMEALSQQQEELGRQQEKLGEQQERLGRQQEQASVPTPDMSKELEQLNAAIAKLQSKKGGTMTQDDLGDLQGRIGDLQGKIGEIEGRIGDAQGKLGEQQGKLGEQQGRLGEQQGKLGEQQGRIAEEADRKIKGIIDQSLHNGKARPVE